MFPSGGELQTGAGNREPTAMGQKRRGEERRNPDTRGGKFFPQQREFLRGVREKIADHDG